MAPLSHVVEAAGSAALARQRLPAALTPDEYFAAPRRVRERFARLVHTQADRIAIVPSVSYAMEMAARNLRVSRGANVVVIGEEFPSAVLPWRRLARERGATVRTVTAEGGRRRAALWNSRLYDAIDQHTVAVVLSHVHWSDGTVFDVAAIAARAREVGAAVLVDGTQSVGALPFDVSVVQPDLLVCAGYKWLMGGYGLSVAYVGPRFNDGEPLETVWTSQAGSDDFSQLAKYRDTYRVDASRYDGGQRASFILAPMLCAAIDQLLSWGVANVQSYCAALWSPWEDQLVAAGAIESDARLRASHLVGVRLGADRHPHVLAANLAKRGIHVSIRGDAVRVSPNVYNDQADIDALMDVLL